MATRRKEVKANFRNLRHQFIRYAREVGTLEKLIQAPPQQQNQRTTFPQSSVISDMQSLQFIVDSQGALKTLLRKCKGGNGHPPPAFGWRQSMWTFLGVFLSISMIRTTDLATRALGPEYAVPLGPMVALLALQFGLTAAPAAQPRSIILGQLISCLVGITMAEATFLTVWLREALAVAISTSIMTKISIVNPPAAANAFLFVGPKFNSSNIIFVLIMSIMTICSSMLINNLSQKRQYPTYWGVSSLWETPIEFVTRFCELFRMLMDQRHEQREARRYARERDRLEREKKRLERERERIDRMEADLLARQQQREGDQQQTILGSRSIESSSVQKFHRSVGTTDSTHTEFPEETSEEAHANLPDQPKNYDLEAPDLVYFDAWEQESKTNERESSDDGNYFA